MVIKTKLLNNEKIKPIITTKHNKDDIMFGETFDLYSNIYIGAKKMMGKSTLLAHILKKCCNKLTTIIIFSSTITKDPTMIEIIRMLRNKGCNVITHEHFIDGNTNLLEELSKYFWKKNRDGGWDTTPIDAYNHAIDSVRYVALMTLGARKEYSRKPMIGIMNNY
jgi:hypothetical protein